MHTLSKQIQYIYIYFHEEHVNHSMFIFIPNSKSLKHLKLINASTSCFKNKSVDKTFQRIFSIISNSKTNLLTYIDYKHVK